jgi:hypothetical protein
MTAKSSEVTGAISHRQNGTIIVFLGPFALHRRPVKDDNCNHKFGIAGDGRPLAWPVDFSRPRCREIRNRG